jgi:hypothetical protein
MYFVTDKPILFSIEPGDTLKVIGDEHHHDWLVVKNDHDVLCSGNISDCEDFIYSIAGWVEAVNPGAAAPDRAAEGEPSFEIGIYYSITEIADKSFSHHIPNVNAFFLHANAHDGRTYLFAEKSGGWLVDSIGAYEKKGGE